jgi:hypothetical protein
MFEDIPEVSNRENLNLFKNKFGHPKFTFTVDFTNYPLWEFIIPEKGTHIPGRKGAHTPAKKDACISNEERTYIITMDKFDPEFSSPQFKLFRNCMAFSFKITGSDYTQTSSFNFDSIRVCKFNNIESLLNTIPAKNKKREIIIVAPKPNSYDKLNREVIDCIMEKVKDNEYVFINIILFADKEVSCQNCNDSDCEYHINEFLFCRSSRLTGIMIPESNFSENLFKLFDSNFTSSNILSVLKKVSLYKVMRDRIPRSIIILFNEGEFNLEGILNIIAKEKNHVSFFPIVVINGRIVKPQKFVDIATKGNGLYSFMIAVMWKNLYQIF